ncbi:hypothetical protein [Vallitalea okinawensis]|uniref:hypothetical protein n=1 Tax=Vallitalea okinawensis TaxID=2078660 RepID=UPI000CFB6DC0|nr:hypothetical protein [Vallitalea okinawensis]
MDENVNKRERKVQKRIQRNIRKLERQKRRQQRTFKDIVYSVAKVSIFTTVTVLAVVVLTTVAMFYYFNQYAFDNTFTYTSVNNYLQEASSDAIEYESTNSMDIKMDEGIFNSLLLKNKETIEEYIPYDYNLLDLTVNLQEKMVYINGRIGITLMPLSGEIDFDIIDDAMIITLNNISVGSEGLLLPDLIMDIFMQQNDVKVSVPMNVLEIFPDYLKTNAIFMQEDGVIFNTGFDLKSAASHFIDYSDNADPIILDSYQTKSTSENTIILNILDTEKVSDEEISIFIEDMFGQQLILNQFIMALDAAGIQRLYNEYGFIIRDSVTKLYEAKGETVISKKIEIAHTLLLQINDYLNNNDIFLLSDGGMMYDAQRQELITVESISEFYELPSDVFAKEIKNCSFYYDPINNEIIVKYLLNEDQILVVSAEYYEIISTEEANKKYPTNRIENEGEELSRESEEAKSVKQGIQTYVETQDDLYFRYLESDGVYAYAIVSFENSYDKSHSYALKKVENQWTVLIHNLDYKTLNDEYTEFNIKLLPPYDYREVSIKQISKYGRQSVIDELRSKGVYPGGSILFSSYIGDYVYIYLTGGEEFVLLANGGTLTEALPRNEAETSWELPFLLMQIH